MDQATGLFMFLAFCSTYIFCKAIGTLFASGMRKTNQEEFFQVIKALIAGGNIDRAIKLCNYLPKKTLAENVKSLLTKANKAEHLFPNFLASELKLNIALDLARVKITEFIASVMTVLFLVAYFNLRSDTHSSTLAIGLISVAVALFCLSLLARAIRASQIRHELELLKDVCYLLFKRLHLAMPEFIERPWSPEDLGAQRAKMQAFETTYRERRARGEPVKDAWIEFNTLVSPDGKLP